MLRFIDLTKCDPEEFHNNDFAFFNTVDNTFIDLAGEQRWNSREEFVTWYEQCVECGWIGDRFVKTMPLNRFISLMPDSLK